MLQWRGRVHFLPAWLPKMYWKYRLGWTVYGTSTGCVVKPAQRRPSARRQQRCYARIFHRFLGSVLRQPTARRRAARPGRAWDSFDSELYLGICLETTRLGQCFNRTRNWTCALGALSTSPASRSKRSSPVTCRSPVHSVRSSQDVPVPRMSPQCTYLAWPPSSGVYALPTCMYGSGPSVKMLRVLVALICALNGPLLPQMGALHTPPTQSCTHDSLNPSAEAPACSTSLHASFCCLPSSSNRLQLTASSHS